VIGAVDPGFSPGKNNVQFVLQYLKEKGIPVICQDTGGTYSRKIFFHTDSFHVYLKRFGSLLTPQYLVEENRIQKTLQRWHVNTFNGVFQLSDSQQKACFERC